MKPIALTEMLSLGLIGSIEDAVLRVGGKLGLYPADPGMVSKLPKVRQGAYHFWSQERDFGEPLLSICDLPASCNPI